MSPFIMQERIVHIVLTTLLAVMTASLKCVLVENCVRWRRKIGFWVVAYRLASFAECVIPLKGLC